MKTIFDVLDANVEKIKANERLVKILYRIYYSDAQGNRSFVTTERPFDNLWDEHWLRIPAKMSVGVSLVERHPGVISTRKQKQMDMVVSLVMRDTFIPKNLVYKIEELVEQVDILDVVDVVAGLRETIEGKSKKIEIVGG